MKRFALLLAALPLASCGLHPMYAGGGSGKVATALSAIEVAPIPGKSGWLMANALNDRLGNRGTTPRYRLEVKLEDRITGLGVRQDDSVTRERRSLRARYQLVELGRGNVVLDATAGSDAGIDVVNSEYATIAAEDTAMERLATIVADEITSRLALFATRGGASVTAEGAPAATDDVAP